MARTADPQRREDILAAARAVFLEHGYANARMASIAERAGVAPGTLYLYFAAKDDLVRALVERYFAQLTATLLPVFAQPDLGQAIEDAVLTALASARTERDLLRLARLHIGLGGYREELPARARLRELLTEALRERMAQGTLVAYDPEALAELLAALVQWVAEVRVVEGGESARGEAETDRYAQTLIALLRRGLLPPARHRIEDS